MTSTASSLPTPISVSTSQAWDNDGAGEWSTFIVNVGTPPQPAKVIVSTVGYSTWVVVDVGCPNDPNYPANCAAARGNIFSVQNSTSWVDIGIFALQLEAGLGYGGNGQFGRDTVTLGYKGSGGPSLNGQLVAGIADKSYWLGLFGLDPVPANFTNLNDPQPSYLWYLRNMSMIPSTSWGYTAGAAYRADKVQGSLTLGGYDSSRFGGKNVTFPFYNDIQRRYTVGLNSIVFTPTGLTSSTSTTTLMSQRISILIDSTTPYIWLPQSACDRFASAFGLRYNAASDIYTLNKTMHDELLKLSPNLTFTLSNTNGETLDIVIPYGAFDLTASFPVSQNSTNYFPLKRASNSTQYTLGRAFLQEAYLIADHDRSLFTVAPCVWPGTFVPDIKAIYPPGVNGPTNNTNSNITIIEKPPAPSSTPIGAIVGGAVGGVVVLVLAALAFWFFYWRPRHSNKPAELPANESPNPTTSASPQDSTIENAYKHGDPNNPELDAMYAGAELPDIYSVERKQQGELLGTPILGAKHEMPAKEPVGMELDSPQIHEMPAREPVASELSSVISPRDPNASKDYFNSKEPKHDTYYNP